jgi:hypothetical protein
LAAVTERRYRLLADQEASSSTYQWRATQNRSANPMSGPQFRWLAAIYVTPLNSRRVVHWELFAERQEDDFTSLMRARMKELEATYPIEQYEIFDVHYVSLDAARNSLDAMRSHQPELVISEEDIKVL